MSDSSGCFPCNCVFFLLPTLGLLPQREGVLKPVALVCLQRSSFWSVEVCGFIQVQPMIVSFCLLWLPQSSARLRPGVGGVEHSLGSNGGA